MSNEFYNFIAKRIYVFFQTLADDEKLLSGESFSLKLDDENMVSQVATALKKLATKNQSIGSYEHCCRDGVIYSTFTLKVTDNEIIIAPQIDGMEIDFLDATLRNIANNELKPLLMISSNPIDSAKSASRDLSSAGMPFHPDQLITAIKKMIEKSTQLSTIEKRILRYELKRRDEDVFSDKTSIYEYKDFLEIMSNGKIDSNNFVGFHLFKMDSKIEYKNYNESEIDKYIKDNNELFEKIERGFRFGNIEKELSGLFEDSFIHQIEKKQKEDSENWSSAFTYAEILEAREKKQIRIENPLKIENENISVYGELPFNSIIFGEQFLMRNEGSQTAKKRTKNLLIFNLYHYEKIHIRIECNIRISNNDIFSDDIQYDRDGKSIIFELEREDILFRKIKIKDSKNQIEYILKLCLMDISADYMYLTVKNSFSIDYKNAKKSSRIKLVGIGTKILFNEKGTKTTSAKLEDNETYNCQYDEQLLIRSTDDELASFGSGIKIDVSFLGVRVPFILFPDEVKSREIIGRNILKNKFALRKSFEFNDGIILGDSQEYFAKTNLLRELKVEQQFINEGILQGISKYFYSSDAVKIEKIDMELTESLKEAYFGMLNAFKEYKTVPTLAYLGGVLLEPVQQYLDAFDKCFEGLNDGENLSLEQENALHLGTILVGTNNDEILLTPFHPLNLKYQLTLLEEKNLGDASDIVIDRLNSVNLLPYIQYSKRIYKVSDQLYSQEWKYYALVENRKYRGGRRYVPKLVQEKISEFLLHFKYIFEDINNKTIKINLINMGDCKEVFIGLSQFFIRAINRNADVDKLVRFELHIYTDNQNGNVFTNIKEYSLLKDFLTELRLFVANGIIMNNLEGILSKNIECYFHKDNGREYEYSHISFYEMESKITSEQATMNQIETGISLGGILSGIPSSKYGLKYRTGFGVKYAEDTSLVQLAKKCNALMQVESSGNPYYSNMSISTQIEEYAENKMEFIYQSSNWVVFVDPKVDLDFFAEKEANSDLLIIHYSDQYTSSSGYDAITVTHKSQQYSMVIQDYLKEKGIVANNNDVHKIINLFNAVNGDWLLRLVSSKKANKDSTFSREKISIVAAIKFMLAFLRHKDIIWVPISLEEMLRVSSGVGLSREDAILSAKNLGFEKGPTSDDLLFIGVNISEDTPEIYLYPVEVKTGNNEDAVIMKAFQQVSATARGLHEAFNPGGEIMDSILYKVNRNFLMQILVTSCKKMQVYHVDDSQDWSIVLERFREALLNEKYKISENIQEPLGRGAVLSFKKELVLRRTSLVEKEDNINFIEMPETDEFGLILKDVLSINKDICDSEFNIFEEHVIRQLSGKMSKPAVTKLDARTIDNFKQNDIDSVGATSSSKNPIIDNTLDLVASTSDEKEEAQKGMRVLFGSNEQDGKPVVWVPNDTTQLFHANTGIIGTMGTGKTQFTKSLIVQLYREQLYNVDGQKLGILIFDYKGDYNESKADFVESTNATILKPYHLPFNPLALTQSVVFKPLLPIHTANAFKDTISKVYGLGPKQQDTLFQCIIETYSASGITSSNVDSWRNEAPTFEQVFQIYANNEEIKKNDSLAAAMNKLHQFEVFEKSPSNTESLFELLKGVVVIDLSGYDSDIQSLIVAITLDLFYSQMQAAGSSKMDGNYRQLTKLILVDEADNFMSEGFPTLKRILKEGREFGVGTILSTQFLKHFGSGEDDYAKYILTWVVHNVSDFKNSDVDFIFKSEPKSQESQILYNAIKRLNKHHSIVKIGNNKPLYVHDKAFWELYKNLS